MKKDMRIAIILSSEINLKDCWGGLQFLKNCGPTTKVVGIYIRSHNRITSKIQRLLTKLAAENIEAIIIAVNQANYLSSYCDDFLRNILHNTKTTVIEVKFEDGKNKSTDSINTPNQVINGFAGAEGFMDACMFSVDTEFPEIKLYEPEKTISLTLDRALEIASR